MQIEKGNEGSGFQYSVTGIQDDMRHKAEMDLLLQPDNDVVVTMWQTIDGLRAKRIVMEFCSSSGGGRDPRIAAKLRELILLLVEENS